MRRELTIEEPPKTAGNLALYASFVSTSAATFPIGDGLDRTNLNSSKIATAVRWLHKSYSFHRSAARRGKGISGAHPKGICFAAPKPT